MENILTHEFIAENLEEIIEDFDYIDIQDVDETTEYILAIWVLLEMDKDAEVDDQDNLIKGSPLYNLNDQIYKSLISDDKQEFINIIKRQLLLSEKYEILSLMTSLLD